VKKKKPSLLKNELESTLLLRYTSSLIEFLPFTARIDKFCKQGRFCWQLDSYVEAFMVKPIAFMILADPPTLLAQSKNTFRP